MKDVYSQKHKIAEKMAKGKGMKTPMASQGGVGEGKGMKAPQAHHGKFWDTKGMKYRQS